MALLVVLLAALAAGACASPERHVTNARTRRGTHAPTKTPTWRVDLPAEPNAFTADDDGSVVVAFNHVVAVAPDGAPRWRVELDDLGIQYPALDRDLVVVSTVTDHDRETTGDFVALDRDTGEEQWRFAAAGEPGPVTFADGAIFVATDHGDLYRLTRTGRVVWHWNDRAGISISSRGSIAHDATTNSIGVTVFVHDRGWYMAVIDATTGRMHHAFDLGPGEPPSATVAAGDGRFVVGTGETHELLVVDVRAQQATSAVRTGGAFDPASRPVVDGDVAYVVDDTGTVTAMDLPTGTLVWQRALDVAVVDARPVVTDDAVVLAPFLGPLTVVRRADGRPVPGALADLAGLPIGYGTSGGRLVVALRLAGTPRLEAWPAP
jgi:outer membrane protein assembly factor BamB